MTMFLVIFIFLFSASCQLGLQSQYTGGITQDTLIGSSWREINADFCGTYKNWYFQSRDSAVQTLRGSILYYQWQPYTLPGYVQPNSENQAVFYLSSGSPGGTMDQYMLVWFINKEGTTAVIQVYTTPEDISRYLVNVQSTAAMPNYQKIPTTVPEG